MDWGSHPLEVTLLLKHFSLRNAHFTKATTPENNQSQIHQLLAGILGWLESWEALHIGRLEFATARVERGIT